MEIRTEHVNVKGNRYKLEKAYEGDECILKQSKVYKLIDGDWVYIPRNEEGIQRTQSLCIENFEWEQSLEDAAAAVEIEGDEEDGE